MNSALVSEAFWSALDVLPEAADSCKPFFSSRMPSPTPRPSSCNFLGPNTSSAIQVDHRRCIWLKNSLKHNRLLEIRKLQSSKKRCLRVNSRKHIPTLMSVGCSVPSELRHYLRGGRSTGVLPPPAGADSDLKLRRDASKSSVPLEGLAQFRTLVVTDFRCSPGGTSGLEQSLWLSPSFHGFSLGSRQPHSRALGEFVADQLPGPRAYD